MLSIPIHLLQATKNATDLLSEYGYDTEIVDFGHHDGFALMGKVGMSGFFNGAPFELRVLFQTEGHTITATGTWTLGDPKTPQAVKNRKVFKGESDDRWGAVRDLLQNL